MTNDKQLYFAPGKPKPAPGPGKKTEPKKTKPKPAPGKKTEPKKTKPPPGPGKKTEPKKTNPPAGPGKKTEPKKTKPPTGAGKTTKPVVPKKDEKDLKNYKIAGQDWQPSPGIWQAGVVQSSTGNQFVNDLNSMGSTAVSNDPFTQQALKYGVVKMVHGQYQVDPRFANQNIYKTIENIKNGSAGKVNGPPPSYQAYYSRRYPVDDYTASQIANPEMIYSVYAMEMRNRGETPIPREQFEARRSYYFLTDNRDLTIGQSVSSNEIDRLYTYFGQNVYTQVTGRVARGHAFGSLAPGGYLQPTEDNMLRAGINFGGHRPSEREINLRNFENNAMRLHSTLLERIRRDFSTSSPNRTIQYMEQWVNEHVGLASSMLGEPLTRTNRNILINAIGNTVTRYGERVNRAFIEFLEAKYGIDSNFRPGLPEGEDGPKGAQRA